VHGREEEVEPWRKGKHDALGEHSRESDRGERTLHCIARRGRDGAPLPNRTRTGELLITEATRLQTSPGPVILRVPDRDEASLHIAKRECV